MLRRLRLPGKLMLAAVPLVLLLGAMTTQFTIATLDRAAAEEETASLASLWDPLQAVIDVLADEERVTLEAIDELAGADISAMRGRSDLSDVRSATDDRMRRLGDRLRILGDPEPLVRQHEVAEAAIVAVRAFFDESGTSPSTQRIRIPEGYDRADEQLLQIGDLMVAEVESVESGRELAAVSSLSRALQAASVETRTLGGLQVGERLTADLETARRQSLELAQWLSSYESAAPASWRDALADSVVPAAVFDSARRSGQIVRAGSDAPDLVSSDWIEAAAARSVALSDFQTSRIEALVDRTTASADQVRTQGWIVLGAIVGATVIALLVTTLVARSIVRRVRSVTASARQVTQEQLPALVEALRDPSEDASLPTIPSMRDRGADEIGDLARSFSAMQSTLADVANEQLEVLRKGVSDMFVTLARRNRSLVDRQLAMIDQLEDREEDPRRLSDFYRLDHLATRMRRNAESLLVLAGADSKRTWVTPLDVDDVVRAALGEVEEYRRIDVLALESVRLQGGVVSDLAHLLSELLENATSFSPPDSRVRIAGHFHDDGYLITISDRGVGMSRPRLAELNELLESPPVIGLALEPTLGLYVVASLARRHGMEVRLVSGAPGLTAHVVLPSSTFAIDAPRPRPAVSARNGRPREMGSERRPVPAQAVIAPPRPAAPTARRASGDGSPARRPGGSDEPGGTSILGDGGPLPVRRPGASYGEPGADGRAVEASARDPEDLRSALTAFQLGTSVGRSDEGDES